MEREGSPDPVEATAPARRHRHTRIRGRRRHPNRLLFVLMLAGLGVIALVLLGAGWASDFFGRSGMFSR